MGTCIHCYQTAQIGEGTSYDTACSLRICIDHVCEKALSFPRGVEGQRVLEATLTLMTETGEVATSLLTHSTSLEVVRDNLRQIYERMASLGRAVSLFYCLNLRKPFGQFWVSLKNSAHMQSGIQYRCSFLTSPLTQVIYRSILTRLDQKLSDQD
jgi:hypothetical protein